MSEPDERVPPLTARERIRRLLAGRHALILTYHGVLGAPGPLDLGHHMPLARFAGHLRYIARHYRCISLPELLDDLGRGRLRANTVCLTFDDGFASTLHLAMPLLEDLGLPATFFITTGPLDQGTRLWPEVLACLLAAAPGPVLRLDGATWSLADRAGRSAAWRDLARSFRALAPAGCAARLAEIEAAAGVDRAAALATPFGAALRMLDWGELRELARRPGVEIGAHTVSHARLSRIESTEARREIEGSLSRLREVIGQVRYFAYPHGGAGDYGPEHREMARAAGYRAVLSAIPAPVLPGSDPLDLPRVDVSCDTTLPSLAHSLGGGVAAAARAAPGPGSGG